MTGIVEYLSIAHHKLLDELNILGFERILKNATALDICY